MLKEMVKNGPINGFPDLELEKLIEVYLKEDTEENFEKIAKRLDISKLVVPLSIKEKEINGLYLMQNPNDKKYYIAAFTSVNQYIKWEDEVKKENITFMIESLANIISILKDEKNITANGLVIDPYGICITIPKEALK